MRARHAVADLNNSFSHPQNIQIDVCKVHGADAVFLQQACHLTGGAYFRLQRRAGLLQYLMVRRSVGHTENLRWWGLAPA
jgi:hypothetical protein